MELLCQPFNGQLGNRLIELLDSEDYHTLNIIVAFAKTSGVLRIKGALEKFRKRGGKVYVHVGIDLGGTSYEALTALLLNTDALVIVHAESGQTFHPKIYRFSGDHKELLIVGSHNLTAGGLWTNFESSLIVPLGESGDGVADSLVEVNEYTKSLASLKSSYKKVETQSDVDNLLANGYVLKEVEAQVRSAIAARERRKRKRLFGNGAPTAIPPIVAPGPKESAEPAAPTTTSAEPFPVTEGDGWQTIWFETRSMTGGSRNILDLSAKSIVTRGDPTGTPFDLGDPKFMRGSVAFFGLDPSATSRTKDVVLNFEGIDYAENTILFPSGAKANGTWRMQIKGKDSRGRKITDAFRVKGSAYLTNKIVAFTKVDSTNFLMSVFPDSEIGRFETASRILGKNGVAKAAKRIGLL